jgi:hypothetical protein
MLLYSKTLKICMTKLGIVLQMSNVLPVAVGGKASLVILVSPLCVQLEYLCSGMDLLFHCDDVPGSGLKEHIRVA